jgi:hypothetical protein
MKQRIWVYSGRPSEGASLLAQEEGFNRNHSGKYIKPGDTIVNWGFTGEIPGSKGCQILNQQEAVKKAINKRTTFQILTGAGIATVPWTTNKAVAKEWLENGFVVVARKTLTGHEGAGIIVIEHLKDFIDAPLYTRYVKKFREFRVHTASFGIIDTQWKVRDPQREVLDWKIRSYHNGFIFQRKGVTPSVKRDELAIKALKALGLDFGGLDIIEDNHGNFYILEINTAPGIEGTSVGKYAQALTGLSNLPPFPKFGLGVHHNPYLDGGGDGAMGGDAKHNLHKQYSKLIHFNATLINKQHI